MVSFSHLLSDSRLFSDRTYCIHRKGKGPTFIVIVKRSGKSYGTKGGGRKGTRKRQKKIVFTYTHTYLIKINKKRL